MVQVRDSGRDTFQKRKFNKTIIKRNKTERPWGFGSDSPIGSGRARGSLHVFSDATW